MRWWDKSTSVEEQPSTAPLATVHSFEEAKRKREKVLQVGANASAPKTSAPVSRPLWLATWPCHTCGETRSVWLYGTIYLCDDCGGTPERMA